MEKNKSDVVACLDNGVMACLDEDVVEFLDKNNDNDFDMDIRHSLDECFEIFLLVHSLEYIIEGDLEWTIYSTPWLYKERWIV